MSAVSFASPIRCRHRVSDERSMAADVGRTPPHRRIGNRNSSIQRSHSASSLRSCMCLEAPSLPSAASATSGSRGIRIDRSETAPPKTANRSRAELHQCMRQINDPIQPGAEQICSPVSCRSRGRIALPPSIISRARNHSLQFRNCQKQFARNRSAAAEFRQKPLLGKAQSPISFSASEILHGRLHTVS